MVVYFISTHILCNVYREFYEKYQVAGEKEAVVSLYEEETQPTVCERYTSCLVPQQKWVIMAVLYVGLFMSSR